MKQRFFFFIFLFSTCIISCSDTESHGFICGSGSGNLSYIEYNNGEKISLCYDYQGNIAQIKVENGTISSYSYSSKNNDFTSISVSYIDNSIFDGYGGITFKKESRNKIIIESSGAPSFYKHRQELELDDNGIPVKITDIGTYSFSGEEIPRLEGEKEYYSEFTYDPETKNLLNQVLYSKNSSEAIATYTYEYDSNPGIMSDVNLPLWFYTYYAYHNSHIYGGLFFNHHNNIIKETIDSNIMTGQVVVNYKYQYNSEGFPISMENNFYEVNYASILY
jgi:hypothetical protein